MFKSIFNRTPPPPSPVDDEVINFTDVQKACATVNTVSPSSQEAAVFPSVNTTKKDYHELTIKFKNGASAEWTEYTAPGEPVLVFDLFIAIYLHTDEKILFIRDDDGDAYFSREDINFVDHRKPKTVDVPQSSLKGQTP